MVGGIGSSKITNQKAKGCVITANYIARARGITTGMPIWEAEKICPDGIFIPGDFKKYSIYNQKIYEILTQFTPDVEEASIDEFYFDLTGLRKIYKKSYEEICYNIKETIKNRLDITVSIGLSINKTWAKLGSNYKKPDAVTTITAKDLTTFQTKIPLKEINGIGHNTQALLQKFNILTITDFIQTPPNLIQKWLGKTGLELQQELSGRTIKPVNSTKAEIKSISRTRSFPTTTEKNFIYSQLIQNLSTALKDLRRRNLKSNCLIIMLRQKNYKIDHIEIKLTKAQNNELELIPYLKLYFPKLYNPNQIYRSTGVILTKLTSGTNYQPTLFTDLTHETNREHLFTQIDNLNQKYGRSTITIGSGFKPHSPKPQNQTLENLNFPFLGTVT